MFVIVNGNSRWDIATIDQLPDYMKVCFIALYNCINEMVVEAVEEQGINITQYLKKAVHKLILKFYF